MNHRLTQACAALLGLLLAGSGARAADVPSAEDILRTARQASATAEATLRAELENEEGDAVPLTISARDGVVSYAFTDPEQTLELVLGADSSELRERRGGRSAPVKPARFDEPVRGTNLTYEDLALRFLYWPRPKLLGEDKIKLRAAWKLEMQAPRDGSQYGVARVWIDQASGAILKIEGYDRTGRMIKRFTVISGQPLRGRWMLKTMRVESMDPASGKPTRRTSLVIRGEV